PDGANVAKQVRRIRERRDLDDVARVRRVDELPVADVHPLVLRSAGARMEEDEVAGLKRARRDTRALVPLGAGVVRQVDSELAVDVHRQAGAVEAGERVGAAPEVRGTEVALGDLDRTDADRPGGRRGEELGERSLLLRVGAV